MQTLKKVNLFWDVDYVTLDVAKHRRFILERVLARGDIDDLAWARATYGDKELKDAVCSSRSLDVRSLNFWQLYFSLSPTVCTPRSSQRTQSAFWAK